MTGLRGKRFVFIVIRMEGDTELLEIVGALSPVQKPGVKPIRALRTNSRLGLRWRPS